MKKTLLWLALAALWTPGSLLSPGRAQEGPNRPQPKPLALETKTAAILVLDLSVRCHDPKQVCSKLMPGLGEFLEKARASSATIIYTVSEPKGTPQAEVAAPLKRRNSEPVIYPNGFDKFFGGELQEMLKPKGVKSVVIVGASTHVGVLYTATSAARMYGYNVIIPLDGVASSGGNYAQEYALHQFTVLPGGVNKLFQFTNLPLIEFR
jgi:nicotinamidase-related amidase